MPGQLPAPGEAPLPEAFTFAWVATEWMGSVPYSLQVGSRPLVLANLTLPLRSPLTWPTPRVYHGEYA